MNRPRSQIGSDAGTLSFAQIPTDSFDTLKKGSDAHAELCANDGQHPMFPDDADAVTKAFCQDTKQDGHVETPRSLADLLRVLRLDFKNPSGENGIDGNPGFAIIGHSSSLVGRFVSSINPRAFVFTPPPADGGKPKGYSILGFTRGDPFVEVAAHDPTLDEVNFYLIFFDQSCSTAPGGCTTADLLTRKLESNWLDVRIYESSTSLNNTIADCLQCHQPDSTGPKLLRMQEIEPPYTHFFSRQTEGGRALLADYHAAHGAMEDFGPIPAAMIDKSDPAKLSALIAAAGFANQPNAFKSAEIESEVKSSAPQQPGTNVPPGQSATWQAIYDAASSGKFIAVPYHDVKVTDPAKLQKMTRAYQQMQSGTLPAEQLPDIRDVFLDEGLRDMGFAPKVGLDGQALLVQVCRQCHNSNLDQSLTRARFNMDTFAQMSRAEKDAAIQRLSLPEDTSLHMPPTLFRSITDAEKALMIGALQK